MTSTLDINGKAVTIKAGPETPLLWVLRDELGLTGTKFGCGMAQCGACTVHVNGDPVRSCVTPIAALSGAKIATIESLGGEHPLQQAWVRHDVPQCGYCQSGMVMAAAALLKERPRPTDADIDRGVTNLCRCGTYARIRIAIHRAAEQVDE